MAIISFINNGYQIKSIVFILYIFFTCKMEPQKVKILTLQNEQTKQYDQYALSLKPLGEGKYAKVYKATNLKDHSKVFAVKVIKITSEEVKQDYLKELKIIKNLPDCPNIVRTHKQHLQSQNNLYIFQQYCQSGTLASYKTQRLGVSFTQHEIYDLFYQTTNGLIFLLQAGIAHQDIKPVNILKKGSVFKLCDFGVSEIQAQYVQTTTRKGTISYMPPQKLKVKKFMPGDKSDIYSLGICLYEVIFGIHPYLKKKTGNYKQYLAALEQATLLPLSFLMKKIGSMSLKLENFFKFLERMIDLNVKTRVGLKELKQFLATTQPFKDMQPIYGQKQQEKQQKTIPLHSNQIEDIFESVVIFKREDYEDNLGVSSTKKNGDSEKQELIQRYKRESEYLMGVISLLISSIDIIRRQNYTNLNLKNVNKNFMDIDLSQCKVSRYIKYLTYEFSISALKKFISNYQNFVDLSMQDKLTQNKAYLERQFNKFLIECDFSNKEILADRLKNDPDNSTLLSQIKKFYEELVNEVVVIEENKRLSLLCTLYCIVIPQILQNFKSVKSVFEQQSMEHFRKKEKWNEQSIAKGEQLLLEIIKLQKQKKQVLKASVQKQLQIQNRDFLFDIDQDSGQIEIMSQELQS